MCTETGQNCDNQTSHIHWQWSWCACCQWWRSTLLAAEAWVTAQAALWVARETAGTSTTALPICSADSLSSEPATPGCCAAWCALAVASSAPFAAAASRFASASRPSCERDTTVKAHGPLIKVPLCIDYYSKEHDSENSKLLRRMNSSVVCPRK